LEREKGARSGWCHRVNKELGWEVVLHGEKYKGELLWEMKDLDSAGMKERRLERWSHTWMDLSDEKRELIGRRREGE